MKNLFEMNGKRNMNRIHSFDGIRGIMAIAVLNCHIMALFPIFAESTVRKIFLYTPLFILSSGGFGVSYFFVLSSFGLLFSNHEKNWRFIIIGYIKRYFRLVPTLILSDFVVFILVKVGFYYLCPGYFDDTGIFKFTRYIDNSRNVIGVIKDSMWKVFTSGVSSYVPPFWTIRLEMLGGCIAIVLLLAIRNKKYKYKIIITLFVSIGIAFLGNEYYYSTIAGVILYEIIHYFGYRKENWWKENYHRYCLISILMIFWLIVLWARLPINQKVDYTCFCGIAWAMLMIDVFFNQNSAICKFLESKPIKTLGKVSFQIYGLHYAVICSIGCFLANKSCGDHILRNGIVIYIIVVSLTIIVASCIWRLDNIIQRSLVDKIFIHLEEIIHREIKERDVLQ